MSRVRSLAAFSLPHASVVLDQGVSSLTNLVGVLAFARAMDAQDFGVFSLGYAGLTLFLGLSRAFFGIPLSIRAREGQERLRGLYEKSMSAALLLFVPIAGVVMAISAIGAFVGGGTGVGLVAIVVGVATPLVMLQDIARFFASASGTPKVALWSDCIWFCGMGLLFALGNRLSSIWFSFSWLGMIMFSFLVMVLWLPWRPTLRGALAVLRPRLGLRESLAGTVLLANGTPLVIGILVTPFFGASAVGSLRGAGTLFGPINTMIGFLDFGVLSHVIKRKRSTDRTTAHVVAATLLFTELIWMTILLATPREIGELILGDSWRGTRDILPFTGVEYAFLCITAGVVLILKVRGYARRLFVTKILVTAIILVGSVIAVRMATQFVVIPAVMAFAAAVGAGSLVWGLSVVLKEDSVHER